MICTSSNISGDAIQAKHPPPTQTRNETMPFFTHPYPFTPHTHTPSDLYQWNHISWQHSCSKSKTFHFAHRQMLDITYNISQDPIQAKQRPLTPSITRDMDI